MRQLLSIMILLALAGAAHAQAALAPWFDADGFFNKPGVELARVTADMTACRAEAVRLRSVRNTHTRTGTAYAFNADGSYNAAVSGAATGIAAILFAIQDAQYNGGIEQIEFRDCVVALGYRHYRLGAGDRERFNGGADHGFDALVAAQAPAEGRLNDGEVERNYFAADLVGMDYNNQTPAAAVEEPGAVGPPEPSPEEINGDPAAPAEGAAAGVISRLEPGQIAATQEGMAIVVASARQQSGSLEVPISGDTFKFRRVTVDGRFVDLLQPSVSFSLRSHFTSERRRDPTLAGDLEAPRYSTFIIPAGRYVLSDVGPLNACLGTLTFEVGAGDVIYLGDFVARAPSVPMGTLFNPLGSINSGMDNRLRADLRFDISEDIDAARQALQADDDAKARLRRVNYQNGYRIPCNGLYIGRVAGPGWQEFDQAQLPAFNDALAASTAVSE